MLAGLILLATQSSHAQHQDYDFVVLPYAVYYKEKPKEENQQEQEQEEVIEQTRQISLSRKDIERCVDYYSKKSGIAKWIYYTIMSVESGFNPRAINYNKNGTVDVGIMQINSATARYYGYEPYRLFDVCTNIKVATLKLSDCISRYGYTYEAIGCYHSNNTYHKLKYVGYFLRHKRKLEQGNIIKTSF